MFKLVCGGCRVIPERGQERRAPGTSLGAGLECQICRAAVSYIRAALANKETKEQIEKVRQFPSRGVQAVSDQTAMLNPPVTEVLVTMLVQFACLSCCAWAQLTCLASEGPVANGLHW